MQPVSELNVKCLVLVIRTGLCPDTSGIGGDKLGEIELMTFDSVGRGGYCKYSRG